MFTKCPLLGLNLDFGIETCFISGMNAYLKTWLQFFYTAGLFFVGVKYSSKLSNLLGNRSVPTLATFLTLNFSVPSLLAYSCHIMTHTLSLLSLDSTHTVWAIDSNLSYGRYPHVFLLLAALACLICLWIPYTLLLPYLL